VVIGGGILVAPSKARVPVTGTQWFWGICSAVGLVGGRWLSRHVAGAAVFLSELRQSWSALTVGLDLLLLGVPVVAFLVIESRRLRMRAPWVWAFLAVPLPGAFVVPLFFLLRERRLLACARDAPDA